MLRRDAMMSLKSDGASSNRIMDQSRMLMMWWEITEFLLTDFLAKWFFKLTDYAG